MPYQFDVLTLGSITVDQFIVPQALTTQVIADEELITLPIGAKIQIEQIFSHCGGCAANVAVGLSRLALRTTCLGVVGGDEHGQFALRQLQRAGVNTQSLTVDPSGPTTYSVVLMLPDGRRTILYQRSLSPRLDRESLYNAPLSRGLYVSHLYADAEECLFEIPYWKKASDQFVSWNPGRTQFAQGADYFAPMLGSIDTLILNVEEAEAFLGQTCPQQPWAALSPQWDEVITPSLTDTPPSIITHLHDTTPLASAFLDYGVGQVIITDGSRGAQAHTQTGQRYFVHPSAQRPVSTLGAGDSFGCGITAAIAHGLPLPQQLRWGGRNAEACIQVFGGQEGLLTYDQMTSKSK